MKLSDLTAGIFVLLLLGISLPFSEAGRCRRCGGGRSRKYSSGCDDGCKGLSTNNPPWACFLNQESCEQSCQDAGSEQNCQDTCAENPTTLPGDNPSGNSNGGNCMCGYYPWSPSCGDDRMCPSLDSADNCPDQLGIRCEEDCSSCQCDIRPCPKACEYAFQCADTNTEDGSVHNTLYMCWLTLAYDDEGLDGRIDIADDDSDDVEYCQNGVGGNDLIVSDNTNEPLAMTCSFCNNGNSGLAQQPVLGEQSICPNPGQTLTKYYKICSTSEGEMPNLANGVCTEPCFCNYENNLEIEIFDSSNVPPPAPTPAGPTEPTPPPTPVPSPLPTPAPTLPLPLDCSTEQALFQFDLTTDFFPFETSWELRSVCNPGNPPILFGEGASSNLQALTQHREQACVDKNDRYSFTIRDSFDDGICCAPNGDGGYTVSLDGNVIQRSGIDADPATFFFDQETTVFGSPTACPTSSPTIMPVQAPLDCADGEAIFQFNLLTDEYPLEIIWDLTNECTGERVIHGNGGIDDYPPNAPLLFQECVTVGQPYTFFIEDTFGDGICCLSGNGVYTLSLDGDEIPVETGGDYGRNETTSLFETSSCSPTASPVPLECEAGETVFQLDLLTDDFGSETSWNLVNDCTGGIVNQSRAAFENDRRFFEEFCLPDGAHYTFTITDDASDGICCDYGEGEYSLGYGDMMLLENGGVFGSSEATSFGSCETSAGCGTCDEGKCNDPNRCLFRGCQDVDGTWNCNGRREEQEDTCVWDDMGTWKCQNCAGTGNDESCCEGCTFDGSTLPPTPEPTPEATLAPTASPLDCSSQPGTSLFQFSLLTDSFPSETSWELRSDCTGEVLGSGPQGTFTLSNTLFPLVFQDCVADDQQYTFSIADSFGDGICCLEGNGTYTLSLNGGAIPVQSGGEFESSRETTTFGSCVSVAGCGACDEDKCNAPNRCLFLGCTNVMGTWNCDQRRQEVQVLDGTVNGEQCSNVIVVDDFGCNPGFPDFDQEGAVCRNDGQADEAYCSYDIGPNVCAYCGTEVLDTCDLSSGGIWKCLSCAGQGDNESCCKDCMFEVTTPAPTQAPTQEPTAELTPAPTTTPLDCPSIQPGSSLFQFDLLTDLYPEEISWFLRNDCTGEELISGNGTADNYVQLTQYRFQECVDPDQEYIFSILDSYGDGICCLESENGNYTLSLNGAAIQSGGQYGSEEATALVGFGPCPSASPTMSPTVMPLECVPGETTLFQFDLLTDNYGSETSWNLVNDCNGDVVAGQPTSTYEDASRFLEQVCLVDGAQYTFTITDDESDGICCGFGEGEYSLSRGGTSLVENGGDFGSSNSITFGTCETSAGCGACDEEKCNDPDSCLFQGCQDVAGTWNCNGRREEQEDTCGFSSVGTWECRVCLSGLPNDERCCRDCIFQPPPPPTQFPTPEVSAPPSQGPIICPVGTSLFQFSLLTDMYPEETSWEFRNTCTDEVLGSGPQDSFTLPNTQYSIVFQDCVADDQQYTFSIVDSEDDGICCEFGNGIYTLSLDGNVIQSGGDFGTVETTSFGFCVAPEPTISPLPTANPSSPPSSQPPTPICDPGTSLFQLSLLTDQFPNELSWKLENDCTNEEVISVEGAGNYEPSTQYLFQQCLDKDQQYTFSIADQYGDGLCCKSGEGSYMIYLDEKKIAEGGDYGRGEDFTFGSCDGPTSHCRICDNDLCEGPDSCLFQDCEFEMGMWYCAGRSDQGNLDPNRALRFINDIDDVSLCSWNVGTWKCRACRGNLPENQNCCLGCSYEESDPTTTIPTQVPSKAPSKIPTRQPSNPPSGLLTALPTKSPSVQPSLRPPSKAPSAELPTKAPTEPPTAPPTRAPSQLPTAAPNNPPTVRPTAPPTKSPTQLPSEAPIKSPTDRPSEAPSDAPSLSPSSNAPSNAPTDFLLF